MGEFQEKLSEMCGAIIGDGWIQSDERCFFLAGDPLEDKEYYDKHVAPLFSKAITPVVTKDFPYWRVYGVAIYRKKAINELLNLGLPKGKKVDSAKIPDWIIQSNKTNKRAFVRGFFDTDGGIFCQKDYTKYAKVFDSKYHSKIRLRMSSVSENLINQISHLLDQLDFRHRKRKIKRGFSNNRNNSDVNIIEINSVELIRKFFNEVIPSNPRHTTKYQVWTKFGFCPPRTTICQRRDILKNRLNPYELYMQG